MLQPGSAGSPESGPAADSKSINSIHSNHVPVLFSPLTAGAAGSAGAASGGGGAGSGAAGRSSNTASAQKERQKVFTLHLGTSASANSLDNPSAMDLSWSRMCCGDVDDATKRGDMRYDFSVILCSNNHLGVRPRG